jgi:hypothetical protein
MEGDADISAMAALMADPSRTAARDLVEREAERLGVALCRRLFELEWLERTEIARAVRVTALGRKELREHLGVETA